MIHDSKVGKCAIKGNEKSFLAGTAESDTVFGDGATTPDKEHCGTKNGQRFDVLNRIQNLMGDFLSALGDLFEMITAIWNADKKVRSRNSADKCDKEPPPSVRGVCGVAILIAIIVGSVWALVFR